MIRAYGTYVMLIGLPAAGKTFLRAQLKGAVPELCIVSTDDYIQSYADARHTTYNEVFDEAIANATRVLKAHMAFYAKEGMSILHDQTNLSAKKRKKVLKSLPDGYEKIAVVVGVDEQVRQDRLAQRPGKMIPKNVDDVMRETFKTPTLEEGWDIITTSEGVFSLCPSRCVFS